MNLETKKLMETWEYIQGGLFFIDETDPRPEGSVLELAQKELKAYILSLSSVQTNALELIDVLQLKESLPFEEIPESLKILTKQDIAYLKEDPQVFDESFGSLSMAMFYKYVSDYLKIPSDIPQQMKQYIRDTVTAELPDITIL